MEPATNINAENGEAAWPCPSLREPPCGADRAPALPNSCRRLAHCVRLGPRFAGKFEQQYAEEGPLGRLRPLKWRFEAALFLAFNIYMQLYLSLPNGTRFLGPRITSFFVLLIKRAGNRGGYVVYFWGWGNTARSKWVGGRSFAEMAEFLRRPAVSKTRTVLRWFGLQPDRGSLPLR